MAPSSPIVVHLALEFWRAGGPRTEARLRALVEHYCGSYAITRPTDIDALFERARSEAADLVAA